MAALDFPASPVNGQSFGKYIYDSTAGVWNANEPLTVARFTPSPTAPEVPSVGDGWFNTNTGVIYIYYVSAVSGYWVQAGSTNLGYPSGASIVTSSTRPGTPFVGQTIYETNTGTTFTWDGTAWRPSSGGARIVTSTTRPASPYVGQFIYETDTELPYIWSGSAWVVAGGGGSIEISATAPSSPSAGDLWWDSDNGALYIYYNDGTSSQWVDAASPKVFVSDTAPTGYPGQLWLDSTDGSMYVYYTDPGGANSQWIGAVSRSGGILQVVSTTKTDTFSASIAGGGNAPVTGLSVTITPRSTSSKLYITCNLGAASESFGYASVGLAINAGSGLIAVGNSAGSRTPVTSIGAVFNTVPYSAASPSLAILYSPNTTSSVTLTAHVVNVLTGTATVNVNRSNADPNDATAPRAVSSITVMEVAG